ncbi:MAG: FG-GAP repeat domain-containing protein [Myxococcota bacterium]
MCFNLSRYTDDEEETIEVAGPHSARLATHTLAAALLALGALTVIGSESMATEPTFTFWQDPASQGLQLTHIRVPVWWDIEGDERPELLYVSANGLERLTTTGDGAHALDPVPMAPGVAEDFGPGRATLATLDLDGDGREELLVFGGEAHAYRVTDGEVARVETTWPEAPLMNLNDAAVGDLNRDGRPDIYFALGRINWEQIHLSGRPDVLWMNRGDGRFEAIEVPHPRAALTHGATLVDLDGDGWLDVVESVDTSWISGPSRILLNRTEPGDRSPSFEVSVAPWDSGTEGRGVAVADVNADGLLDLYSASVGHDLFALGHPDGFTDATFDAGFHHLWTPSGPRYQWSPRLVDINLDGRLDLLARHGAPLPNGDALTTSLAPDLVYTQGADETFSRVRMPSTAEADNGFNLAVGDLDGDGRPDVARDGLPGGLLLWRNTTPVPSDARPLTVDLAPTVSGAPATGAILEADCGGEALLRHLTQGGTLGASEADQLHVAPRDCGSAEVNLRVRWPSGAVTEQSVGPEVTHVVVSEPLWATMASNESVLLEPAATGASQACLTVNDAPPVCCAEACTLAAPLEGALSVALEDHPPIALRDPAPHWLLMTEPALPKPGAQLTLHIAATHAVDLSDAALEVTVEGAAVPWSEGASGALTAQVALSPEVPTVTVALRSGDVELASWTRAAGYSFDAQAPQLELYPTRLEEPGFPLATWEAMVHLTEGDVSTDDIERIKLTDPKGALINRTVQFDEGNPRRVRVTAPWDALKGLGQVTLYDHLGGVGVDLPVNQPEGDDALLAMVSHATCGLRRPRMRAGDDMSPGVLTVYDQGGHRMWLPARLLELTVTGGRLDVPVSAKPPMRDLLFVVGSQAGGGEGAVIIQDANGRELGSCAFSRWEREGRAEALESHTLTFSKAVIDIDLDEVSQMQLGLYDVHGELLGADAWPDVLLTGGSFATPVYLSETGAFRADIAADPAADAVQVSVILEGKILDTQTLPLVGLGDPSRDDESAEPTSPESPEEDGGCQTSSPARPALPLVAIVLALIAWRRRIT